MSILAKKENLLKIIGTVIILFGLLLSLIFDFFLLNSNFPSYIFIIITIIPILSLIMCFKLELNIIRNNPQKFFYISCCYLALMIIIGVILRPNGESILSFIIITISNLFLISCWHFSFSIYKKEKILFIVTGLGYILITVFFKVYSLNAQLGLYIGLIPLFCVILGMCIILISEARMKKKGLLNYI